MPGYQVTEEPQCRIRIDPNLVDKFKRLRGGINEVGTKIVRDIGLRYEHDKLTGAFDILGPDPEILSLAIETLRFWVDEDLYPRTGITCQVGYPNKGIVFWRFHGDYARKFDHLFDNEIENLKQIPSLNIKAVPSKKNPEFVEIYCNFATYHRVKDEIMRISSELVKIHQDDFFVPISDFHKARRFARSKGKDKSVLFALKEYMDSDKFRVWIFARDYGDIIRARKEWMSHVGKIARDTSFEERRMKLDRQQVGAHEASSLTSAQFFGHESSKESDMSKHKPNIDQRRMRESNLSLYKMKLNERKDKFQRRASGSNYDNPNFPRPNHMFYPVQKEYYDVQTNDNSEPDVQHNNPWLDPALLRTGHLQDGEFQKSNHLAESKWITEPAYQLYQAKKPYRPNELDRIYMHHQVHKPEGDDPKTELTLVKHPETNLIKENIVSLRKSQIITAVNDHRFAPRVENRQPVTATENVTNNKKTSQQLGSLRQAQSLHSMKQMKHREAQSNIRYHINVNGLDIFMYRQNVAKLTNVDAIVNVVDQSLQEGGNIAKDVAAAAGKQVEDEIKVFLFNNGPLKVAETCVTSAGKIPCLGIINVAGPKWEDYFSVEEKCAIDLHTAIYNTLKTAEKHKYRKIGLPAICGESYFGIPKEIVAEVHVKALVDYSLGMGPLYPVLEIHLVDTNVDMLYAIKQAYEDWASSPGFFDMAEKYKSATGGIPNPMKDLSQKAQSAVSLKDVPTHRSKNVVTFVEQSYTKEGHQMWTFDVLKKMAVHVYVGSIVKLDDVEAIVCGVDRKMKGTLAKLIRFNGGIDYDLALSQARGQRSLVEGEVVVCTAGNLPVKWVFHSVISQPIRKASLKNLSRLDSIYTQIFHAANKLDIKSLAMPLIGAGRLREKFEIEQCSLQLVDNIVELCLSTGQELKLREIHLVNVSELNTQYLCQALRTRAHTKLRVENDAKPPSRQEMFTSQEHKRTSPSVHHRKKSKPKAQNHPESPKRLSPPQKRHGRILIDKNALLEEQFKRTIRDMEEERRAAIKKSQNAISGEKNAVFNPRMVNSWLQNMDGKNGMVKYRAENYQNGYSNTSLPNGVIRHGNVTVSITRNDDVSSDQSKVKSRAESYHHSYHRYDQMASHRENWDLVRQRSHSTDALPRRNEDRYGDGNETYRSTKNNHDSTGMYPDVLKVYANPVPANRDYEYSYENKESHDKDSRFYSDYERSPRKKYDTYESVVTEREARESDYELYRNRDEPRFRYHREDSAKPVYDSRTENDNSMRNSKVRRSGTKDLNEEIDRLLKERNKGNWQGPRKEHPYKEDVDERTYNEKERMEKRELQKLWAINDEFQKDLEINHAESIEENKEHAAKELKNEPDRPREPAEQKIGDDADKDVKREMLTETEKESKLVSTKSKSTKDTRKSKFKYDNRIIVDSSKHKSKKKDSKKAKRNSIKSQALTHITQETEGALKEDVIPVQDGRTDVTAASAGTASTMKRYDSQIDKRYRQFDRYTNSDVYPRTPELSRSQEMFDEKRSLPDGEGNTKEIKGLFDKRSEDKNSSQWPNKKIFSDNKSEGTAQSERVMSLKSISSRPTVDSRTVQLQKEGGATAKTFSVLAGDIGMMEKYQNLSGKVANYNSPIVKVV